MSESLDTRVDCKSKGSEELIKRFKLKLASAGLAAEIRTNKAGCLDTCEYGPSVVIYPDGVWYGRVGPEDVDEIVQSHLVEGCPVERLRISGK